MVLRCAAAVSITEAVLTDVPFCHSSQEGGFWSFCKPAQVRVVSVYVYMSVGMGWRATLIPMFPSPLEVPEAILMCGIEVLSYVESRLNQIFNTVGMMNNGLAVA